MTLIGVGYRRPFADWLATQPPSVGCIEITAEHFFDSDEKELKSLSDRYPLFVHGLGLSLGTPGPIDNTTLKSFAHVAKSANAEWVSEHVAFTRTDEVDLGHLNPLPFTEDSLEVVANHAMEVSRACGKPIILENITSELTIGGSLSETEFLNRLCDKANCGLLLDVTNLYINGKNHGFDPLAWLSEIDPHRIVQIHIVGFSERDGHFYDHHSACIQEELMDLLQAVMEYSPVQAITLERDGRLDDIEEINSELCRLEYARAKSVTR